MAGLRVFIRSTRKGKRACVYCNKKCNGCLLPFSVSQTVEHYIKISEEEFKLEIVFDEMLDFKVDTRSSNFNQYTTIDECLE